MQIVNVDLHAPQQTILMPDNFIGEIVETTLEHAGDTVQESYSGVEGTSLVGIEATGSMQWFLQLM